MILSDFVSLQENRDMMRVHIENEHTCHYRRGEMTDDEQIQSDRELTVCRPTENEKPIENSINEFLVLCRRETERRLNQHRLTAQRYSLPAHELLEQWDTRVCFPQ